MDLILNKSQYQTILFESVKTSIENSSEESKNLIKRVVSNVKKNFDLDLKFILTYSVTIGGLIGPVEDLVRQEIPHLGESELSLIIVGTIMTFYYNNREVLHKILKLIRDKGLINEFNFFLQKTERLKDAFLDFVTSLGVSFGSMSNILGFTFLLNILGGLLRYAENDFNDFPVEKLVIGLLGYFGTLASKEITREIIEKVIKRFREK